MRGMRRLAAGLGLAVLTLTGVAQAGEIPAPAQTCRTETGMQGQVPAADQDSGVAAAGYCRNFEMLATTPVEAGTERGNVARFEHCAYSGTTDDPGLAVVDISDPTAPLTVASFPGVGHTWDTLAVDRERRILVAKTRMATDDPLGGAVGSAGFVIFSIGEDCTDLRERGTFDMGRGLSETPFASRQALAAHEFQVTPDGRAVVISLSIPDLGLGRAGTPSMIIADIRDLDTPRLLTTVDLSALLREQGVAAAALGTHDFDFNPAGTRMYAGLFTGQQQGATPNPVWRGTAILDTSRLWDEEVAVVRVLSGVGGHTVRWGRVGERELLVTNTEFDCLNGAPVYAPAGLQIVDITDERAPRVLSNPTLEVNATPANCLATAPDRTSNWAHFGNFDDRDDARLYFATWSNSGVRAFDLRDPAKPVEVAYVNPSAGEASAYSYPTYEPSSRELVWGGPGVGVAIARLDRDALEKGQGRRLRRPARRAAWRRAVGQRRKPAVTLLCMLSGDRIGVAR